MVSEKRPIAQWVSSPDPVGRPARRKATVILRSIDDPWADWFHVHVGQVWTVEEFAAKVKVTLAQVEDWIKEGLPVLTLGDGGVRITETAVDEWVRSGAGHRRPDVPVIEQEWITIKQGARLTGLSYSSIRRAILRGDLSAKNAGNGAHRHYRILRADLDGWIRSLAAPAPAVPKSDIKGLIDRYFPSDKAADS